MTLPCPQCGAEIRLQEASGLVRCPFCGTSLVLELTGARPHFLYLPRVRPAEMLPILRRLCDAHGLAAPAPLGAPRLMYYPFWRYAVSGRPRLVPAWPTLDAGWGDVRAPDAEQRLFDPALLGTATLVEAQVEETAARRHLGAEAGSGAGDLVHLPFYEVAARSGRSRLRVSVDACSGEARAAGIPEERRRRPVAGGWLAVAAFGLMLLAGALLPTWWLAAAAILPLALVLYWTLMAEAR
ncbi:MAG: hypothetical protein ACE147_17105 [Candidatus Methylomirabilales bacterium]